MNKCTAVIDADSILFAVATSAEAKVSDDEYLPLLDEEAAFKLVVAEIEALTDKAECDRALVCLTDRRNFRTKIYPEYKSNRKGSRRPALLEPLRQMTMTRDMGFGKLLVPWLEADDLCGISYGTLVEAGREAVIVSADKDMRTIPCMLMNPRPSKFSGRRHPIEEVTKYEADREHLKQTLTGDTVDGYPGCPGIGNVKANKLIEECETLEEIWDGVVERFEAKGLSENDAVTQARMARILRSEDWDVKKRKVDLWTPKKLKD